MLEPRDEPRGDLMTESTEPSDLTHFDVEPSDLDVPERFSFLRRVATTLMIVGGLVMAFGGLAIVMALAGGDVLLFIPGVSAVAGGVGLVAAGQAAQVLIAIEHNTRASFAVLARAHAGSRLSDD